MIPRLMYSDTEKRPERRGSDYYPTPLWLAQEALRMVRGSPHRILDPGAGNGVWGRAARECWPMAEIVGVEVRDVAMAPGYDLWVESDFREIMPFDVSGYFDLVIGNPPYRLAEEFVRAGMALLNPGGELIYLVRLAFLASQRRRDGLFRDWPPAEVAICSKRPSFNPDGRGTNSEDFCVIRFVKDERGPTVLRWLGAAD